MSHWKQKCSTLKIQPELSSHWLLFWVVLLLDFLSQDRIYHPMPQTLAELLQHAEHVVDDLNNNKQAMVVRSVLKMKARARACVAVGGGVFEGRRVWICLPICQCFEKSWLEMNKWFEDCTKNLAIDEKLGRTSVLSHIFPIGGDQFHT